MCLNPHCITPFCTGCSTREADARSKLYVYPARRDGKHRCSFVYPRSGRILNRVLTPEALAVQVTSGSYQVIYR